MAEQLFFEVEAVNIERNGMNEIRQWYEDHGVPFDESLRLYKRANHNTQNDYFVWRFSIPNEELQAMFKLRFSHFGLTK